MVAETKELRGLTDANLVRALDAIALAKGLDRNAYVNQILEAHIKSYANEHSLVDSMTMGNPYFTDASRKGSQ